MFISCIPVLKDTVHLLKKCTTTYINVIGTYLFGGLMRYLLLLIMCDLASSKDYFGPTWCQGKEDISYPPVKFDTCDTVASMYRCITHAN